MTNVTIIMAAVTAAHRKLKIIKMNNRTQITETKQFIKNTSLKYHDAKLDSL